MADSWNKKEREKKKQQAQKAKEERKRERKENAKDGNRLDDMLAYVDEDGNISSTPPDPSKRKAVNAEDIVIGVPKQEDMDPSVFIREGIITHFNDDKGYGFIRDLETKQSIFVHVNQISEPVGLNDKVSFVIGRGPKGPEAQEVKKIKPA